MTLKVINHRLKSLATTCFVVAVLACFNQVWANENSDIINLSQFNPGDLSNWETKEFEGVTRYNIVKLDNEHVLKATSRGTASGLFVERTIDITKTPYLNWSWRIEKPLPERNEAVKANDDYSARIYVVVSGGWLFWKTKALNFVWSGQSKPPRSWPNAFAPDNALMVPLRDATSPQNVWINEKVNIRAALKDWLGKDTPEIHGIAIMTDTDNAGGIATAYYDNIYFSEK